jgi:predicted amidophosphoribosyltransferase
MLFFVSDTFKIKNKNILLVDDIITTGSTLEACANLLIKTGVNKIHGFTIAKTV